MNAILKRVVSLILCFVLIVGYVPVSAFAEETGETVTTEATDVTTAPTDAVSDETEAPSESTEAPTDPSEETSEPTDAATAPTDATTAPTEAPTVPTEAPTEPEEDEADKTETTVTAIRRSGSTTYGTTATAASTGDVQTLTKASDGLAILDAAIFCSDVHGSTSDLTSVLSGVKTSGVDYSAIGFVGDTCLSVANTTSTVQSALGDTDIAVMFSYAKSHDTENSADISTNWNYSGEVEGISDYYLVYTIRETDMQSDTNAEDDFTTWYNGLSAAEKKLPIFIMSHRPLHARRNDNAGAADWYTAISAAAATSDIVFFWAHNHTGESSVDTAAYYVEKNGTETISVQGGSTVTPNFTYMNAGYINANNQNPARIGVATTVQITANNVIFQDYNSSGAYSGSYAHNVTVERNADSASATPTLESIAISGTTEYTVGDALALTVTAAYSDGTTADVTADATLTGYDMSAAGTQTVTATYEGKTATFEITVSEAETEVTENTWYSADTFAAVTATATNATLEEVLEDTKADSLLTDWFGYTISLDGQVEDTAATVKLWLDPSSMSSENLAVYRLNEETGEYELVTGYTVATDEDEVEYVTIENAALGTYVYGTPTTDDEIPAGAVLDSIEIVESAKTTKYFDSNRTEYTDAEGNTCTAIAVDISDMVVKANYVLEGTTYSKTIEWNEFDTTGTVDGYALSHDPLIVDDQVQFGEKTVTLTYGDKTAQYSIWVCKENETIDNVTISFDTPSVVSVTAAPAEVTETITTALAEKLTGTLVSYDITAQYANGDTALSGTATVTLPVSGLTNPAVYYVSDDGETERMTVTGKTDTTVTFETDHFSKFVVGDSTEITVPDPSIAENITGTITTTKTIYKLVASLTAGGEYLIVSRNSAGSGYGLADSTTGVSVTVKAADSTSSVVYIEDKGSALEWTATDGWAFTSGSHDLGYSNGLSFSTEDEWTFNDNRLYQSVRSGKNTPTYYLRCNNDTWSASTTSSNVYFYQKTEVETTTTTTGTYSIAGNPAEVSKVVVAGTTTTLGSTLTFVPESGTTTTTDTSTTAKYTVVENGDPKGIISGISGNTVNFTGAYGKALVKVSYDTNGIDVEGGVVTNYITVEAKEPYYELAIMDGETNVTGKTIAEKGVTSSTTLQLSTQITLVDEDGSEVTILPEGAKLEWNIPAEYQVVATIDQNGLITFKGVNGAFYVTATLTVDGKSYTAGVNISSTTTAYSVPSDGTSDFPEYPNEGAIRYDKTATAVGNFSETGIAQVELSMTGVPYTTGSEIDVVLMLDMTGSMDDVTSNTSTPTGYVRIDATIAASKAFIETIVKNEDGTYNGNRIGVYVFNKNGAATLYDFGTVDSDTKLEAINADLNTIKDDHFASGGTPYDDGLSKCQSVLAAAKTDGTGNDRQQFCVFMTDGVPTSYAYVNGSTYGTHSSADSIAGMLTSSDNYATRDTDYKYEYYSTQMKKAGVTVYSVGVGLENENNAWSGSATQCLNLASVLLNDISGPGGETTQPDAVGSKTLSKKDYYFFSVEDATAATDMEKVFSNIAQKILQAATDITVEDQISDEYTMIFDIPTGSKTISGVTNDFYIEFLKYELDENHERTDSGTSITKLYLGNSNGRYYAASDANGTAYDAPAFEQTTIGEKGTLYYWSTNADDGDSGVSVTVEDGTTYYFVSYGMEEAGYNMTSGAYASGIVDSTTNMSDNLVIATPYFVYNASTKMLYWTVDKLDTAEYALRYFLYLENSATEVGTSNEADPGSYMTNDHAYITYTNFNGNDCRQEFPKPQLTWNGAQVSYVFYLVNAAGQPINKSGQVVDFANATFITDVHTKSVVWNKDGDTTTGTGELSADWLADDLLPDTYEIYDEKAQYKLNVYENADGSTIKNQFTISGGTAAEISNSLNTRLGLSTTTASIATTKVYNTKAGEKISAYGTYTSADEAMKDFDFSNTTVAFAVVWQPRLVEDVVVVDYGLDVLINVVQNDILQNTVSGIGVSNSAYGNIAMNTGVSTTSELGTAALTIEGNTISIENENAVRFQQGDMQFEEPVVFYYETPVEFWEGSDPTEGFMYSSVTVIPATTIYYEDSFVDLTSFSKGTDGTFTEDATSKWTTDGTTVNATQDQDRPGASQISEALDADNNYGYDSAYTELSTHSMGSAAEITVDANTRGEATFTFYGTGFDVISTTSNATGTITVKVTEVGDVDNDGTANEVVKNTVVDTFYGMDKDGNLSANTPNAIYQVPVIKISNLTYGNYTVKITAGYNAFFDHNDAGSYVLYLDAVRIYDPTGNQDTTANNAYAQDGEAYPIYEELRDNVIAASEYEVTENADGTVTVAGNDLAGAIFIDCSDETTSIADYVSYGPNNELYLANNQAIAFNVAMTDNVADVQLGIKVGNGNSVTYEIKGDSYTVNTTTDMYYSILKYAKAGTVTIKNVSGGILSLTNIKLTHTSAPVATTRLLWMDSESATAAVMSLRTASTDVEEETTAPETTDPSESETTEPSEPETTEPSESETTEPETTVPEETEPENDREQVEESVKEAVKNVVNTVKNALKKLFSRWFR